MQMEEPPVTEMLHAVARAFRASLPQDAGLDVFHIDGLDRLGIPVMQASLQPDEQSAIDGYGYGATAIEAEVGALGELCEETHAGDWIGRAPFVTASHAELVRRHGAAGVVDPLTLCLSAGSDYTPEMELNWVQGRRHPSGEAVLVPQEWIAAYPSQLAQKARLIMPITNGLGAGLDLEHAIAHGVMELLQRDGNVVSYRALDRGVVVDLDEVPDDIMALVDRLRGLGIALQVKLASTEGGIANLYVVGDDAAAGLPIQITSCGEAAHPDSAHGLRKALLEFAGSRARKATTHGPIDAVRRIMPAALAERRMREAIDDEEESRALEAMAEWIGLDAAALRERLAGCVFAARDSVAFSSLPTVAAGSLRGSAERLAWLTDHLARQGMEILWVDCSPVDGPVKVVRVIVPGLETETMSYYRIGWRGVARLRRRGDPLLLDAPRDGARRVRLRPEDDERAGGPAWFDVTLAAALVDRLYPLYRESGPFSAQLLHARILSAA
jgi:thiazole/oxazole-forming peptide maturase SagD family component